MYYLPVCGMREGLLYVHMHYLLGLIAVCMFVCSFQLLQRRSISSAFFPETFSPLSLSMPFRIGTVHLLRSLGLTDVGVDVDRVNIPALGLRLQRRRDLVTALVLGFDAGANVGTAFATFADVV